MRLTISTSQLRRMVTMIIQQLLSVVWLVASQQVVKGFFLVPNRTPNNRQVERKSGLSSFPVDQESEESNDGSSNDEPEVIRENDLSMFLATQEEEEQKEGFDPLEFFMTVDPVDESIQKLQEVEDFFREESMGIMLEEQTGVIPTRHYDNKEHVASTDPVASETIKMKSHDSETINIEEDPTPKKVFYFSHDSFGSKTNYYTE